MPYTGLAACSCLLLCFLFAVSDVIIPSLPSSFPARTPPRLVRTSQGSTSWALSLRLLPGAGISRPVPWHITGLVATAGLKYSSYNCMTMRIDCWAGKVWFRMGYTCALPSDLTNFLYHHLPTHLVIFLLEFSPSLLCGGFSPTIPPQPTPIITPLTPAGLSPSHGYLPPFPPLIQLVLLSRM